MKKIKIEDATAKDLFTFATLQLGLDVANTLNGPQLISKIRTAGWQHDEIEVPDEEKVEVKETVEDGGESDRVGVYYRTREIGGEKQRRAFMNITIPENERVGGAEHAPVNCNGKQLYIPRNKICAVPIEYVDILSEAEEQTYKQADGPEGGVVEDRKIKTYPFTIERAGEKYAELLVS